MGVSTAEQCMRACDKSELCVHMMLKQMRKTNETRCFLKGGASLHSAVPSWDPAGTSKCISGIAGLSAGAFNARSLPPPPPPRVA